MRQPLIVANWKMYKNLSEAESFTRQFPEMLGKISGIEMVICAPYVALASLSVLFQETFLILGAQNMHWEKEGAYTGEISPLMLREVGVRYVIIGHSERRTIFGETNEIIARKIKTALEYGLYPILCMGENAEERQTGKTEEIIKAQVEDAIADLGPLEEKLSRLVVAYEPVWAIGTGNSARGEDAAAAARFIRSLLEKKEGAAEKMRIIYGGSVTPENITEFTGEAEIDGVLVGGGSLKANVFAALVRAVDQERRG